MHSGSDALSGLRKELLEFMRSCEALLSIAYSEALSEDEVEIIRNYVQWLSEGARAEGHWALVNRRCAGFSNGLQAEPEAGVLPCERRDR